MALPIARGGKPRHLEAVGTEDGDGGPRVSLADRLAAAQAAVAEPQRRVSGLEAALAAAVDKGDYATAAAVQAELPAAREELALAEVDVRVIGEAQAALNATADAERQQVAEARQRGEWQRVIEEGHLAEREELAARDADLAEMRECLGAARAAGQRAASREARVYEIRSRVNQAKAALGEFGELPPGHPGPKAAAPNKVQVLIDTDPVVRALMLGHP